jgi:hypothetical protein
MACITPDEVNCVVPPISVILSSNGQRLIHSASKASVAQSQYAKFTSSTAGLACQDPMRQASTHLFPATQREVEIRTARSQLRSQIIRARPLAVQICVAQQRTPLHHCSYPNVGHQVPVRATIAVYC